MFSFLAFFYHYYYSIVLTGILQCMQMDQEDNAIKKKEWVGAKYIVRERTKKKTIRKCGQLHKIVLVIFLFCFCITSNSNLVGINILLFHLMIPNTIPNKFLCVRIWRRCVKSISFPEYIEIIFRNLLFNFYDFRCRFDLVFFSSS